MKSKFQLLSPNLYSTESYKIHELYFVTLQNSTLYLPQGSSEAVLDNLSEAAFDVLARQSNRQNETEGENNTDTACE